MKEAIGEYFSSQEDPEFFTKDQLARRWQVNERYVRNLITSGKLKAIKLGGGPSSPFRIPRSAALDLESVHIFPNCEQELLTG